MTDMEAINAEAHRHMRDRVAETSLEYAEKFADIRDQLIKEGWQQPEVDEAQKLDDDLWEADDADRIKLIRAALAKARAHPADVVEAARRCVADISHATSEDWFKIANYVLKDV